MGDNRIQIQVSADMQTIADAFTSGMTQIGMDAEAFSSQASKSFSSMGNTARAGLRQAQEAQQDLNESILNGHQSVHLLLDDFGVHMPRAVVGAIAESIPLIQSFSGVILAAFAFREIPELVEKIHEGILSWEGFGQAERDAMDKAIKDTEALRTKVVDVEKELDLFGKNQAQQALMQAQWANEDADRALKPLLAAEKKVKAIQAEIAEAKHGAGAFAAGAGSEYAGALQVAQAEVGKLREAWKLADENALLAQKRSAQAALEEDKRYTQGIIKDAKEAAEAARKYHEEVRKQISAEIELHKARVAYGEGDTAEQRKEAEFNRTLSEEMVKWQRDGAKAMVAGANDVSNAMKKLEPEFKQIPLDVNAVTLSMQKAIPPFVQWAGVVKTAKEAAKEFRDATAEATVAMVVQGIAAHESAKKIAHDAAVSIEEQAFIQALWEAAQGAAMEGLFFFTDNPKYQASADAHFVAAAIYGSIGGAAAGVAAATKGSGGGGGGRSSGASASDSSLSGGQTILQIQGKLTGASAPSQMAAWLNMGSAVGMYKITSQGASGIGAPLY